MRVIINLGEYPVIVSIRILKVGITPKENDLFRQVHRKGIFSLSLHNCALKLSTKSVSCDEC
jgi:hypothetical protein